MREGCGGGGGGGGGGQGCVKGGGGGQGCIGRAETSEVAPEAPEAVRQAVGGGCQSGWGAVTVGYKFR